MGEGRGEEGWKRVIFQTTARGFATEIAMRELIEWYRSDTVTHPLIRTAIFVYDLLSIHPLQDGNGRMSRLLSSLLLLRQGYSWIEYVSFEHEIENRKSEYYAVLMQCQSNRPGEDVSSWVLFFLDCLKNIQNLLIKKLEVQTNSDRMSPREKMIYVFVKNHPGSKSGEIAEKLDIPLPTANRILADILANKTLLRHGAGAGTNYTIEDMVSIKRDRMFRLGNTDRIVRFDLTRPAPFIELRKIILTPLF